MRPSTFCSLSIFVLASLFACLPPVIVAQTVSIQNGTTVRVQNGTAWSLENGAMDFGPSGSTARLDEQGTARITDGQLTATRALSSPSSADPVGLGLQITASKDLDDVTITRGHDVQTASNGNESIERYYDVSPSQNNSGLDAELVFTYHDAELNGRDESELEFFRSNDGGSTWLEEGFDSRDATANTVTLGGVASLSRWTLGGESAPLPVELASFVGTVTNRGVTLTWETVSETNNTGFEVQRRREGAVWQKIGFVESKAAGGTSDEALAYQFGDSELPYAADSLSYRLRQVDLDGSASLTDPVTVQRSADDLELLKTFPNPARSQVTVRFAVPERQTVALRLYDVMGRQVQILNSGKREGRHEMQVEVSRLPSGTYFLQLQAGKQTRVRRLTVIQ